MSDNKNIEFTGTLSRDEIPLEIQKIDALLTYSENEACPNHVLEAMSCAKPILYKNSGAMKEIIEDCGFEVSPGTFNEIITQRKIEFDTIGKRSRNRIIDKFESSDILKKYLRIIENEFS
jgi:glycosyltransferase involved in cell wall biosynthesis